ncbi:manganese-dependent inorganic pyrophosphatase [Facklamia miroungae]|uniref:Probable manganese-dependent inorganic pyrophosphatase n=1 Tax=Facklamia miroungae TaxID=120956 RepID=A0A1G7P912_9LACT|nr:manganese-dependent inorganic pyrophosphatase [Facklamia miroungae]NKZ28621.1 manganese-dependent inorganic pyrophosphatase [Facklamia miroungae]SDF82637.1 manganese-dependent inorganic pyrophosphatase [Facklamia miroungae]
MTNYLVFGHKKPDTDTIASAIAFAYFLKQEGHQAEAVALGEITGEPAFALDKFGVKPPRIIQTAANEVSNVALVDHNEPQQSVDDIDQVQIDYVIDHHRISGFNTPQPLYYRAEPLGSTATILYKMFKEYGYEIPADIAGMMLSAIISDTLLFKSPTTTEKDKEIAEKLAKIAEVDIPSYGLEFLKAGADLSKQSDEEIVDGDAKNFVMNDKSIRIGQTNIIGFEEILSRKNDLLKVMEDKRQEMNLELYVLVITDVLESDSIGLVVGDDVKVVEAAFNTKIENHQFDLPGVVSRKKQVVPPLTSAFNK